MSKNDKVKITLQILENSYPLMCEPHESNLLIEAAEMLNRHLQNLRKENPKLPFERLIIMGGLQMSYDLLQERQTVFREAAIVNQISKKLIDSMQKTCDQL